MSRKKRTYLLALSLLSILLFQGCENNLEYKSSLEEPLLTVNAQMDAIEDFHTVYLSLTGPKSVKRVEDALVKVFVNGEEKAVSPYTGPFPDIIGGTITGETGDLQTGFMFRSDFKEGDVVRIEASAEGGKYSAQATVAVPRKGTITKTELSGNGERVYVSTRDEGGQTNYYRLSARLKTRVEYVKYGESLIGDTQICRVNPGYDTDPILAEGGTGGKRDEDSDDIFGNDVRNNFCTFTNRLFFGSRARIGLLFSDNALTSFLYDPLGGNHAIIHRTLGIECSRLSEDQYNYYKALDIVIANDDEDDDVNIFSEPVTIPSNVEGGTGFVSILNPCSEDVVLPDMTYGLLTSD